MSEIQLSDQLKCHKCGQMLDNDQFDMEQQFNIDDETRICIVCTNTETQSDVIETAEAVNNNNNNNN